jgi:F-type H+-transporting ATPase subunit epsilon
MSAPQLYVSIASISESHFSGIADSLTVPGVAGEMTILANHEPIITALRPGNVVVKIGTEKKSYPVTRGVLEVSNSAANVLL